MSPPISGFLYATQSKAACEGPSINLGTGKQTSIEDVALVVAEEVSAATGRLKVIRAVPEKEKNPKTRLAALHVASTYRRFIKGVNRAPRHFHGDSLTFRAGDALPSSCDRSEYSSCLREPLTFTPHRRTPLSPGPRSDGRPGSTSLRESRAGSDMK